MDRVLPERALQPGQTIPERRRVRPEVRCRRLDQPGKGGDQGAGLIQIPVRGAVRVGGGQAQLFGGGAHQHDRGAADHLDRGDVHQVASGWRGPVGPGLIIGLVIGSIRCTHGVYAVMCDQPPRMRGKQVEPASHPSCASGRVPVHR